MYAREVPGKGRSPGQRDFPAAGAAPLHDRLSPTFGAQRCGRMPDPKKRADRREQQSKEVEASQAALRANIDEARRLVDESDKMLKRHRRESESDDAG